MTEIWKPVVYKSTETIYEVSSTGRVRNKKTMRIKNQRKLQSGYMSVILNYKIDNICKETRINSHKLVAQAFLPNNDNLSEINHKDGNPSNNRAENLEWCTHSDNVQHAYDKLNRKPRAERAVKQYDLKGTFLREFKSIKEAGETIKSSGKHISTCAKGKRNTAHGYIWKYVEEDTTQTDANGMESDIYPGYIFYEDGKIYSKRQKCFMKTTTSSSGYQNVCLRINKKTYNKCVHRLIAEMFLENEENRPYVSHKDNDNTNNHVSNLEWTTGKEYADKAYKEGRNKTAKIVQQFSKDGEFIQEFSSLRQANLALDKNINATNILNVCKGNNKTAYDFVWKYKT